MQRHHTPGRHKIPGWVEQHFTDSMIFQGIEWLKTDFGGRGDRVDWVAVLPWGGVAVSRYLRGSLSGGWNYGQTDSLAQAMDEALQRTLNLSEHDIARTITRLRAQIGQQHVLRQALGYIPEDVPE